MPCRSRRSGRATRSRRATIRRRRRGSGPAPGWQSTRGFRDARSRRRPLRTGSTSATTGSEPGTASSASATRPMSPCRRAARSVCPSSRAATRCTRPRSTATASRRGASSPSRGSSSTRPRTVRLISLWPPRRTRGRPQAPRPTVSASDAARPACRARGPERQPNGAARGARRGFALFVGQTEGDTIHVGSRATASTGRGGKRRSVGIGSSGSPLPRSRRRAADPQGPSATRSRPSKTSSASARAARL